MNGMGALRESHMTQSELVVGPVPLGSRSPTPPCNADSIPCHRLQIVSFTRFGIGLEHQGDCGSDGDHPKDEPGDGGPKDDPGDGGRGHNQGNIDRATCPPMCNLLHAQSLQRPWQTKLSHA